MENKKHFKNYLNLNRMNLRFLVAHAECLTVSLTERSTVRLTGSLFLTVRLTERSLVRLTVRQSVCQSVRQGVRHDKLHRHRPQIEKVGTDGSQRGNQRLPWQGTAGSQTLKLTVPNLGTNGLPLQRTSVS